MRECVSDKFIDHTELKLLVGIRERRIMKCVRDEGAMKRNRE